LYLFESEDLSLMARNIFSPLHKGTGSRQGSSLIPSALPFIILIVPILNFALTYDENSQDDKNRLKADLCPLLISFQVTAIFVLFGLIKYTS
jgi:hypothetical protein